jgi:hypothetical protein
MFTNKSTVELIPQNEINSDFGVLLFRSASFNKFDKRKYQNFRRTKNKVYFDGTPNDLAVQKIYECLLHKHRSVFFGSRILFSAEEFDINFLHLSKDERMGIETVEQHPYNRNNKVTHSISVYLVMRWLYYKPWYIKYDILNTIERQLKEHYPACYKALQILPKENVTEKEKNLLGEQKTRFISFKVELPIFIARQLYRHRAINFTERSGRYTAENTRFFEPDAWRQAPQKATQGSLENEFVKEKKLFGFLNYKILAWLMQKWFFKNVNNKNSKELCRIGLPQSQITITINSVDLASLSSILYLRLDKHTQKETRDVAEQIYEITCQEFGKELVDKLIDIQKRLIF